jgi:hypothetical protein
VMILTRAARPGRDKGAGRKSVREEACRDNRLEVPR